MHYEKKANQQRQSDALSNVLWKNLGSSHTCESYFDGCHLNIVADPSWRDCSLMAVVSFGRIKVVQEWFEEV